MKVKSYFTQKKLKKEAAKEKLVDFGAGNHIPVCYSQHWIKVKRTYVPKNYILGTYTTSPSGMVSQKVIRLYFYLITGEEIFFDMAYEYISDIDCMIDRCRKILPNALVLDSRMLLHWTYNKKNRKRMLETVTQHLKDENAWFNYIYQQPEPFLDLLADEKVNQKDFYKLDDSDLYFSEFPDEAETENEE